MLEMNNIPRQHIYLIGIALFLFIFVLIFSFSLLIPTGKEYRNKRLELRKGNKELREYKLFHADTLETFKTMQEKNRMIIRAFNATFNPKRFEKENKNYFSSLHISRLDFKEYESSFAVYEVNTTSEISSPASFYDFLDAVNKSDWIIGINFPIHFQRENKLIKSSFTMKVYCNNKESNSTASKSVDK